MKHSDFFDGLHRAYLGEIGGAALARALLTIFTEQYQREALAALEALEVATAMIVAPLLQRNPMPAEIAEAEARGRNGAQAFDWPALIDYMAHQLDTYIEDYTRLRDAGRTADHEALELLVAHEVALKNFGQASLVEPTAAVAHLHRAVEAAERYLATPR